MGEIVQLPARGEQPPEESGEAPAEVPAGTPSRTTRRLDSTVEPLWRESVGRALREERLAAGKRLIDVAEEAGVSPQYLSEVERGLKDPSSELLAAITGALGLSVAEIATRVAGAGPSPQAPVCLAA